MFNLFIPPVQRPNQPNMYGIDNKNNGIDPNDPNYVKKVGAQNVSGLTNMAGNFGGALLGIGGSMLGNLNRQMENQSLDYMNYQRDMQNSMQDSNIGGGLQNMGFGGKPKKYPMGGIVGSQLPQPVQTEKGEKVISNKGDIFDTKATKTHKQMDSDEITDLFPSDSISYQIEQNYLKLKQIRLF